MKEQKRTELLDLRTKQKNKAGRDDKGRSHSLSRKKTFRHKDLIAGNVRMGISIKDSERERRGELGERSEGNLMEIKKEIKRK